MPPATANLAIYQGDDQPLNVAITQAGGPYDLTGHTFTAQIRASSSAATVLGEFECTVTDAPGGLLTLLLDHDTSAALPATAGTAPLRWDLQSVDAAGTVTTFLAGSVTVTGEITRP